MRVVCISGKARHGKDTFAEYLRGNLEAGGNRVLIIHYADQLKFICEKYFGWDGKKDERGRSILQRVGTETARAIDPYIWIKYVDLFLGIFGRQFDYVLIPDCRFPNEIDWLRGKYETLSVDISRGGSFDNGLTDEQKNHPSETALDDYKDFDIFVFNSSGLRELDRVTDDIAMRFHTDGFRFDQIIFDARNEKYADIV